jgi:hypothetical protein
MEDKQISIKSSACEVPCPSYYEYSDCAVVDLIAILASEAWAASFVEGKMKLAAEEARLKKAFPYCRVSRRKKHLPLVAE